MNTIQSKSHMLCSFAGSEREQCVVWASRKRNSSTKAEKMGYKHTMYCNAIWGVTIINANVFGVAGFFPLFSWRAASVVPICKRIVDLWQFRVVKAAQDAYIWLAGSSGGVPRAWECTLVCPTNSWHMFDSSLCWIMSCEINVRRLVLLQQQSSLFWPVNTLPPLLLPTINNPFIVRPQLKSTTQRNIYSKQMYFPIVPNERKQQHTHTHSNF